jgi:trehalose synthase
MDAPHVRAILGTIGLVDGRSGEQGLFVRQDGSGGEVVRPAAVVADTLPGLDDDLLIQVSRWDRLKDMNGVMHGWARHVAPECAGYLADVQASRSVQDGSPGRGGHRPESCRRWPAP